MDEVRDGRSRSGFAIWTVSGREGEFLGCYKSPLAGQDYVRDDNGTTIGFRTASEAVAAAGGELCKSLNMLQRVGNKDKYLKMSAEEFSDALADLELAPDDFARLYGTEQRRVLSWIEGGFPIPHPVRLIMAFLTFPGAIKLARQITNRYVFRSKEFPTTIKTGGEPNQSDTGAEA